MTTSISHAQTSSYRWQAGARKVALPLAFLTVLSGAVAFAGPRMGMRRIYSLIPAGAALGVWSWGASVAGEEIQKKLDRVFVKQFAKAGELPADEEARARVKRIIERWMKGAILLGGDPIDGDALDLYALHLADLTDAGEFFSLDASLLMQLFTEELEGQLEVSREGAVSLFAARGWDLSAEGEAVDARAAAAALRLLANPELAEPLYRYLQTEPEEISKEVRDLLLSGAPVQAGLKSRQARAERMRSEILRHLNFARFKDHILVQIGDGDFENREVDPELWINHLVVAKKLAEMGLLSSDERYATPAEIARQIDLWIEEEGGATALKGDWATVLFPDREVAECDDLELVALARLCFLSIDFSVTSELKERASTLLI